MAEPHYVAVSPHNYNSTTIGLAATLQASACMPNFVITEYFTNFEGTSNQICYAPFEVAGGFLRLPTGPGLGLELNEEALLRRPYRQYPVRSLPGYDRDGA